MAGGFFVSRFISYRSKADYFLIYFWLSLTISFGPDQSGSGFLTNRSGLKDEKDLPPLSSFTWRIETDYTFFYIFFVPTHGHIRDGSKRKLYQPGSIFISNSNKRWSVTYYLLGIFTSHVLNCSYVLTISKILSIQENHRKLIIIIIIINVDMKRSWEPQSAHNSYCSPYNKKVTKLIN